MAVDPKDEHWHAECEVDEWVFAAWTPEATAGVISGYRIIRGAAWYWVAAVQEGHPMLHLIESDIQLRSDPLLVKAHGLWAEHICLDPLGQWSIGNEAFAVALSDPADGLGQARGVLTPIGCDLEWYATASPVDLGEVSTSAVHDCFVHDGFVHDGFVQDGVMHGLVEIIGLPSLHFAEAPARRWRRWGRAPMGPLDLPVARAHSGLRAVFAFPDQTVADLVLTSDGWHHRQAQDDRVSR